MNYRMIDTVNSEITMKEIRNYIKTLPEEERKYLTTQIIVIGVKNMTGKCYNHKLIDDMLGYMYKRIDTIEVSSKNYIDEDGYVYPST